tara:strand:+ start:8214 stop:8333 length:120 start_codon:yes stop_codon:yes gene_type:complete
MAKADVWTCNEDGQWKGKIDWMMGSTDDHRLLRNTVELA